MVDRIAAVEIWEELEDVYMDVDASMNVRNVIEAGELADRKEYELCELVELHSPVRPGNGAIFVTPSRFRDTLENIDGITGAAADDCEVLSVVGGGEIGYAVELPTEGSLLRLLLVEVHLASVGVPVIKSVWKAVCTVVMSVGVSMGVSVRILAPMLAKKLDISPVGCSPGEKQSGFSIVSMVE